MLDKVDILTDEQVQRINEEALKILENVGVDFEYEPAIEVLQEHGVRCEGSIAYFDPDFVMARLKEAPSEFTLEARDPAKTLTCGDNSFILSPSYGPPFIYDLNGKSRLSTLEDYNNIIKLAHVSQNINHTGGNVCEPNDIPESIRPIKMLESHVRYSDKPFMGIALGAEGAMESIEIAKMLFGDTEAIKKKPVLNTLINSITPLKFDERMLGALMVHAEYGQSCMVSSLVMSGSTGPVTMVETLALQIAECLAGIVLAQCVNPGAPVIMGSTSGPADMATMGLSIGSAETALYTAATAQMARFYGIPSRGGGGLNDSILADAQAGYESMLTLKAASDSGISFVLHAAGIMHYYNSFSYEKFIIDDEIAGLCKKFREGYNFDESRFVFDDVAQVGHGGHYLYEQSTVAYLHDLRPPLISVRDSHEGWETKGSLSVAERAAARVEKQLAEYVAPELDPALDKELTAYIESRTKEHLG